MLYVVFVNFVFFFIKKYNRILYKIVYIYINIVIIENIELLM